MAKNLGKTTAPKNGAQDYQAESQAPDDKMAAEALAAQTEAPGESGAGSGEATAKVVAAPSEVEPGAQERGASSSTVIIETVAEKVATLTDHVQAAAKAAHADADHAAHGVLENFMVHLHEFKGRLVVVEGRIKGEADELLSRIKALL